MKRSKLAVIVLILSTNLLACSKGNANFNKDQIAKASMLQVRIQGDSTAVTINVIGTPGGSFIASDVNQSGVTSTPPETPLTTDNSLALWEPLMTGAPKDLPTGDTVKISGRIKGKSVFEIQTSVDGAKNNVAINKVVTAALAQAKSTYPELTAKAADVFKLGL